MKMTARRFLTIPVLVTALLGAGCDDSSADGGGGGGGSAGGDGTGGASTSLGGGTASGGAASGGGTSTATGCSGLCEDAGYTGGTEEDYGGGVIECLCEGTGDDLEQAACSEYCTAFDVSAANSFLSSQNDDGNTDKCVCDGTSN